MKLRIIVEIPKTQDKDLGVLLQIGTRDGSTVISLNVYQVWSDFALYFLNRYEYGEIREFYDFN